MMLIACVIIILCTVVASKYFSLTDSTTAVSILKEKALEKVSSAREFHIVKAIEIPSEAGGALFLNVDFEPDFPTAFTSTELDAMQALIQSKTRYSSVAITVN